MLNNDSTAFIGITTSQCLTVKKPPIVKPIIQSRMIISAESETTVIIILPRLFSIHNHSFACNYQQINISTVVHGDSMFFDARTHAL